MFIFDRCRLTTIVRSIITYAPLNKDVRRHNEGPQVTMQSQRGGKRRGRRERGGERREKGSMDASAIRTRHKKGAKKTGSLNNESTKKEDVMMKRDEDGTHKKLTRR